MDDKATSKNFVFNFINTFCSVAIPVIVFSYVSRILSVEGIGAVNFSKNVITFFSYIATLGIINYGTREISKVHNDKARTNQIFSELWCINFISTAIAFVLLAFSCIAITKFQSYELLIWIYSLTMFCSFLGAKWLYMGLGEYGILAKTSIVAQVIALVLTLLLVKTPEDIWKYALLNVISTNGYNLVCFFEIKKRTTFHLPGHTDVLKHLKPVIVLWVMEMVVSVSTTLDTVMLGFLSNDYEVGIYTAGVKIYRIASMLIASFSAVIMPLMCECYAKNEICEMKKYISQAIDMVCMFGIPLCMLVIALRKNIILVLSGEDFLDAVPVVSILAFLIIVHPLSELIVARVNISIEKEKNSVLVFAIGAIVNIIGNSILIPNMGAIGASISTAFSETLMLLIGVIFSRNYLMIDNQCKKNILFYVCVSIPMFLVTLKIRSLFDKSIILLCVYCIAVALLYLFCLLKLDNTSIKHMIKSFLKK